MSRGGARSGRWRAGRHAWPTGREEHVRSPSERKACGERSRPDPDPLHAGPRSIELGVARGPFGLSPGAGCVGRKQGLVRENVDAAGETLRGACDELDRSRIENLGTTVASGSHAKVDVVLNVAAHQGLQVKALCDAL